MNISQLYIKGITYDLKDSVARYGFATASVNNELSQDGELDTSVLTFYADQAKQSVLGKIKLTKIAIPNLKSQKLIAKDLSISNEGAVSVTSKLLDSKQNLVFQGSRDKKQIYLPLQKNGVIAFISDIEEVVNEKLSTAIQNLDLSSQFTQFVKKDEMARVAFSGDYNDLKNKPQISNPSGSYSGEVSESVMLNDNNPITSSGVFKETHTCTEAEWEDNKVYAGSYNANTQVGQIFITSGGTGSSFTRAKISVAKSDVIEITGSSISSLANFYVYAICDKNNKILELAENKKSYDSHTITITQDGFVYACAQLSSSKPHSLKVWKSKFVTIESINSDEESEETPNTIASAKNTIRVDKEYWDSKIGSKTVFSKPNTKYIIAGTAEELCSPASANQICALQVGKNCIITADPGCMLGPRIVLILDRTYIDVGPQQIFSTPTWELGRVPNSTISYTLQGTLIGTNSTFANGQILPEWWGCKSGEGVLVSGISSYHNHKTEEQAYINSFAINYALLVAGDAEVYLQGNKYVVGSTICIGPEKYWGSISPNNNNPTTGLLDCETHGNRNPKFRVKGNLIASDEFVGKLKSDSKGAKCEIPTIIYVSASGAQINIEGALVVPYKARDKKIVVLTSSNWQTTTPELGNLYFVGSDSSNGTGNYQIYDVYEHYTGEADSIYAPVWEIQTRNIGKSMAPKSRLQALNRTDLNSAGGCNGVMPGMYAIHLDYFFGGVLNIGRIIKGEDRGGRFNVDSKDRLTSFRYRTEVWHIGECAALNIGTAQASDINIGNIVGFNDGITNSRVWMPGEDYVQHLRFNIGNIHCNNAIHITTGNDCRTTMVGYESGGGSYFNACNWRIGGTIGLCAGSNTYSSTFTPTTTRSTFLFTEHSDPEGNRNDNGFNQHMIILEPCPDSCYYHFIDFKNANGNYIKGNGGIGGDTGRLVLWTKGPSLLTSLVPPDASSTALAEGENFNEAWFPMNSCLTSSLWGYLPAHYNHIAAQNKFNYSSSKTMAQYVWDNYNNSSKKSSKLYPKDATHSSYDKVKQFPYNSTTSFITFRASSDNTIESNQHDLLCYEAVCSDTGSWNNTLIGAQSMYALYEQTGDKKEADQGFWGVRNYKQPYFKYVKFNNDVTPKFPILTTNNTYRVMYVDEFALGSLHFIESKSELPAQPGTYSSASALGENKEYEGLYVVTQGDEVVSTTTYYGYTLYPMYHVYKYNPSTAILGRRSNVAMISEKIGYYCDELGIIKLSKMLANK